MVETMEGMGELQTVMLIGGLPERKLRRGQIGAIVCVHDADHVEVEFVTLDGTSEAIETVETRSLRVIEHESDSSSWRRA